MKFLGGSCVLCVREVKLVSQVGVVTITHITEHQPFEIEGTGKCLRYCTRIVFPSILYYFEQFLLFILEEKKNKTCLSALKDAFSFTCSLFEAQLKRCLSVVHYL